MEKHPRPQGLLVPEPSLKCPGNEIDRKTHHLQTIQKFNGGKFAFNQAIHFVFKRYTTLDDGVKVRMSRKYLMRLRINQSLTEAELNYIVSLILIVCLQRSVTYIELYYLYNSLSSGSGFFTPSQPKRHENQQRANFAHGQLYYQNAYILSTFVRNFKVLNSLAEHQRKLRHWSKIKSDFI